MLDVVEELVEQVVEARAETDHDAAVGWIGTETVAQGPTSGRATPIGVMSLWISFDRGPFGPRR